MGVLPSKGENKGTFQWIATDCTSYVLGSWNLLSTSFTKLNFVKWVSALKRFFTKKLLIVICMNKQTRRK